MQLHRKIGKHKGTQRGPMVVVFGAIHGNEIAGVTALKHVFQMIEKEPSLSPNFTFKGTLLGLVGNMSGLLTGERFINEDMNRMWSPKRLHAICQKSHADRNVEERELLCTMHTLRKEIAETKPEKLIFLDLHTTSAKGGVFTIPDGSPESLALALNLHAPVVQGLLGGIGQTSMHFIRDGYFDGLVDGFPKKTVGLAFESGQHNEPKSVDRAVSAIINCLRGAGCLNAKDVEAKHDDLLTLESKPLPKVVKLEYVHHIKADDGFKMRPGYENFQQIKMGDHLADDMNGPIHSQWDARILMPLYQSRGVDGFFVVRDASSMTN